MPGLFARLWRSLPRAASFASRRCFFRRSVILEGMQVLAKHLGSAPKEWLFTYVNELLALPVGERGVGDLKEHIAQTFAVAKPWLKPDDLRELAMHLDGTVKNSGVPAAVIAQALAWILDKVAAVKLEWSKMHNPRKR